MIDCGHVANITIPDGENEIFTPVFPVAVIDESHSKQSLRSRDHLFRKRWKSPMKKPSPTYKVCPKCDLFWGLEAEDDHYFPVHKADQLETCPTCQTPLEVPQGYHYIFVNKRAVADAKAKEDNVLKQTQRENARLARENQELRRHQTMTRSSLPIKPQPQEEHPAVIDGDFEKGARYLLKDYSQQIERLKAENQDLRNTILQLQETLKQQDTTKHQPANLPRCLECGKEFEPQTQTHQYCSKACQIKTNNRKRAERREQKKRDEGTHHTTSNLKIFPTE